MTNPTKIDLCVISYNTKDKLKRLLDTLHSDYDPDHPVVWDLYIADNDSTDGTREWWESHANEYNVSAFMHNENIGYASAANQLASFGDGDVVAILNADTWFTTAEVRSMGRAFEEDDNVGVLGPKQRDEDGHITHGGIFGTETKPKHRGWRLMDELDVQYRDKEECLTVSGSAYLVRRSLWDGLAENEDYKSMLSEFRESGIIQDGNRYSGHGAFLPTKHYYEETWVSYFARHLGYHVFYDGRISIGHTWHASSKMGGEADQLFRESKAIFVASCDWFGIPHD